MAGKDARQPQAHQVCGQHGFAIGQGGQAPRAKSTKKMNLTPGSLTCDENRLRNQATNRGASHSTTTATAANKPSVQL